MADVTISQVGLEAIQNFDLKDPRTLRYFVDNFITPHSFLKDMFFPTAPEDIFKTSSILIDNMKRRRGAAPFVLAGSKTGDRDKFVTDEYKPARIAPARKLTIDNLEERMFGESLFSEDKPTLRAIRYTINDLRELNDEITRREEIMCSEVLRTNGCEMQYEQGDGGTGTTDKHIIKFYEGAQNPQKYTPAASWAVGTTDILGDIGAMRKMITKTGNRADVLLVSPDVTEAILDNEKIIARLNNRRYDVGSVSPVELPKGAVEVCRLNINGAIVTVIEYGETYEATNGDDTPYLPAGTAILTAFNCGRGLYGGIKQTEEGTTDFQYYDSRRVPKIIIDRNADEKKLQLVSRPLMVPASKGAWISATAIF